MRIYAHLLVAMAGRDVEEVAAGSGVPAEVISAAVGRGVPMDRTYRKALAAHLSIPERKLFREWALLGDGLVDLEPSYAAAPSRDVTDTATLRTIGTT